MKAKLGIAPIAWWNDDLAELSDDVSLEECLRQASVAGFTGMETGRRFPMDMAELGPILARHGNMSSPSVLFALEEALAAPAVPDHLWLTAFGAGFSAHSCRISR